MTRIETIRMPCTIEIEAEITYEVEKDEYSRSGIAYCNPKLVSFEMPTREAIEAELKQHDLMEYLA